MEIMNFIIRIITFAAALACAGTLVEITMAMKKEAINAHQIGIIKLGDWNRSLNKRTPTKESR
jgi:hypothetical protein